MGSSIPGSESRRIFGVFTKPGKLTGENGDCVWKDEIRLVCILNFGP